MTKKPGPDEQRDIMSFNQQVDAAALIKELENLFTQPAPFIVREDVTRALLARYREKWPDV